MGYIALYRKWRPKQFEDIVGQEHITTTLRNQIMNNRIVHAYLFTGTRGTGKTSMAKIFAKAVNCPNNHNGEPCENCNICEEIESSRVLDILEIDAASNNGVDEIRELREKVKYPPSLGSYKVYIIDEVHMLSQGAFNALLKTLEEPPSHVIFILATTEPHKLPATILSRCQRFDFKRVSVKDMVDRMAYICNEMDITIEEEALELIANNAGGALRDGLSILDQCLSLSKNNQKITYEDIVDILGLVSNEWLYQISQSIIEQDIYNTMELFHQVIDGGKDIIQMAKQLAEHFRNILMAKTLPQPQEILELSREQIGRLKNQGEKPSEERLLSYISSLSQIENTIKYSSQPMIILEMELIKLCKNPGAENLKELIDRIETLEREITNLKSVKREAKIPPSPKKSSRPLQEESITPEEKVQDTIVPINKGLTLEEVKAKWEEILKEVKREKVQVEALLKEGELAQLNGNKLIISFDLGFHQAKLSEKDNIKLLERIISRVLGSLLIIECVMQSQLSFQHQEEDPVQSAIKIFGEDVVEVVEDKED